MSQSPSTVAQGASTASASTASSKSKGGFSFFGLTPLLLVLYAAVVALYGVTSGGMSGAFRYWQYFIPVLAVFSLISGWGQAYLNNNSRLWYLVRQVILWGGLMLVLYMLDQHNIQGALSDESYTILLVYLIAFATAVAAVQMDSKLFFFAIFLVYCAYLLGVPENNPVLIKLGETFGIEDASNKPMLMTVGVAAAAFVASWFVVVSMRGSIMAKRASRG